MYMSIRLALFSALRLLTLMCVCVCVMSTFVCLHNNVISASSRASSVTDQQHFVGVCYIVMLVFVIYYGCSLLWIHMCSYTNCKKHNLTLNVRVLRSKCPFWSEITGRQQKLRTAPITTISECTTNVHPLRLPVSVTRQIRKVVSSSFILEKKHKTSSKLTFVSISSTYVYLTVPGDSIS